MFFISDTSSRDRAVPAHFRNRARIAVLAHVYAKSVLARLELIVIIGWKHDP